MVQALSKIGPRLMLVAVFFGVGVAVMYSQVDAKLERTENGWRIHRSSHETISGSMPR